MPYLSRSDLENIGKRVTKAYSKLLEIQDSSVLRADISASAQKVIGLKVEYHKLSPNQKILGVTSFFDVLYRTFDDQNNEQYAELDGKTILIESTLGTYSEGRKNFTIAHETSHHILQMLYPQEYGVQYRRGAVHLYRKCPAARSGHVDWNEWQADVLASIILMPADSVRACMMKYGLGTKMKRLNRIFSPNRYQKFSDMASFMGVSKTALALRMTQLGFLEECCLKDPYELVCIYPDAAELYLL